MKNLRHQALFALVTLCTLLPEAARACDQCMGGKDPRIRPAINGAIFFMLGLVGMMGGGIGLFMRYLSKRAHLPLDPHHALIAATSPGGNHV